MRSSKFDEEDEEREEDEESYDDHVSKMLMKITGTNQIMKIEQKNWSQTLQIPILKMRP